MLLNALVTWNDSTLDVRLNWRKMKRYEFYMYCAQRMLEYEDPDRQGVQQEEVVVKTQDLSKHIPLEPKTRQVKCIV